MKMNYNIYYFFVGLIALLYTVKGVTMTKKEVLNLELKKYNTHEKCPEFSEKSEYPYKCSFTFYCIDDDNCQSDNNSTSPYFYFSEKDNTIKTYIKEYCFEDSECSTEKCTIDSDCLSNNCKNSTCYAGKSLFTECSDIEDADFLNYGHHKMKCGRPDGESCNNSDECAGKCTDIHQNYLSSTRSNNCASHESFLPTNPIHVELIFIPAIVIIICCCYCLMC